MTSTEYVWAVRKGNTARLSVQYQQSNGTVIDTTGCIGTLYVYNSGEIIFEVEALNVPAEGRFEIFLSKLDILDFDFRQAEYEFNVMFPNGDEYTLLDGPLVIESGRGPFE